jgi:hypothetical protein
MIMMVAVTRDSCFDTEAALRGRSESDSHGHGVPQWRQAATS